MITLFILATIVFLLLLKPVCKQYKILESLTFEKDNFILLYLGTIYMAAYVLFIVAIISNIIYKYLP